MAGHLLIVKEVNQEVIFHRKDLQQRVQIKGHIHVEAHPKDPQHKAFHQEAHLSQAHRSKIIALVMALLRLEKMVVMENLDMTIGVLHLRRKMNLVPLRGV